MYLLTVHIPFLAQIIRTEQEWHEDFRTDVFQRLALHHFVYSRTKKDYWLFISSDIKNHDADKVTQALDSLLECFHKWDHCVRGCLGLMDYAETEHEKDLDRGIETLLRVDAVSSTWISDRLKPEFQPSSRSLFPEKAYRYEYNEDKKAELEYSACVHTKDVVEALRKALKKWASQRKKSRKTFSLAATPASGVDIALRKICADWSAAKHIVWFRNIERASSYAVVRNFFASGDIEQYFHQHGSDDLHYTQNLLERIHPSSPKNYSADEPGDIIAALTLVVEHILSAYPTGNIYFVCEWIDTWDYFEYTMFFSVLDEIDTGNRISCILLYNTAYFSSSRKAPSYTFKGAFNYQAAYEHYGDVLKHKLKSVLGTEELDPVLRFSLLVALQYGWLKKKNISENNWPATVFSCMPRQFLRVLYIVSKSYGILFSHEIVELLQKKDVSEGQFQSMVKRFVELRMLSDSEHLIPGPRIFTEDIAVLLEDEAEYLNKLFSQYVWQKITDGGMHPTEDLFRAIVDWLLPQYQLHLYLVTCEYCLDTTNRFPHALFEYLPCDLTAVSDREKRLLTLVRRIVTREYYLMVNKSAEATLTEHLIDAAKGQLPEWILSSLYASIARALYERDDHDGAVRYAKQTLMLEKTHMNARARAQAFYVMGLLVVKKKRYTDSRSYYLFAIEGALAANSYHTCLHAAVTLCAQYFTQRDFSTAMAQIDRFLLCAQEIGQFGWELIFFFMQARIHFELGNYSQARQAFLRCAERGAKLLRSNIGHAAELWAIRCLGYTMNLTQAEQEIDACSDSAEVLFVKAEICLLKKEFGEALEHITKAEGLISQVSAKQMPYSMSTGYSFIEDLHQREDVCELRRFIVVLRAYLLFQNGLLDQSEKLFHESSDDLKGQEWGNTLYYYTGAVISHKSNTKGGSDVNLVSKGVTLIKAHTKYLHDQNERNAYLYKNYWNNKLMRLAKERYIV